MTGWLGTLIFTGQDGGESLDDDEGERADETVFVRRAKKTAVINVGAGPDARSGTGVERR